MQGLNFVSRIPDWKYQFKN